MAEQTENNVNATMDKASVESSETVSTDKTPENTQSEEDIVLASSSHTVESQDYGDDDSEYLISFMEI